jgi:hypothetical protein
MLFFSILNCPVSVTDVVRGSVSVPSLHPSILQQYGLTALLELVFNTPARTALMGVSSSQDQISIPPPHKKVLQKIIFFFVILSSTPTKIESILAIEKQIQSNGEQLKINTVIPSPKLVYAQSCSDWSLTW